MTPAGVDCGACHQLWTSAAFPQRMCPAQWNSHTCVTWFCNAAPGCPLPLWRRLGTAAAGGPQGAGNWGSVPDYAVGVPGHSPHVPPGKDARANDPENAMPRQSTDTPASYLVGAYAAAPSQLGWDPAAEATFLDAVLALDGVSGLEVPFTGALHKYDEEWFLQRLPPAADVVLTLLPGTMARLKAAPSFGIASTDDAGRRAAVDFAGEALRAIGRLNQATGRESVTAVQVHTAPVHKPGLSSPAALAESLAEIASWNWGGVQLVIEHCDAAVPGQPEAKGFLGLEAEAETVTAINERGGMKVAMAVNWGRTVIEQRRPEAAEEQISFLRSAGLLGGLTFSGCSDVDTRFGPAWADVHVPPAPLEPGRKDEDALEPASLLTPERIRASLTAAGAGTGFRALKFAAPPAAGVAARVAAVSSALGVLTEAGR